MVNSLDEVIERLQYKADNIKAKLEPSYFTECIEYLKTLTREENIGEDYAEKLVNAVAKVIVEVFENLSIEDVNMYKVGYNKAIDEFAEKICEHCRKQTNCCNPLECPFCRDGCYVLNIANEMKVK